MQFRVGRTYHTRAICDATAMIEITVVRRTAKTIVTEEGKSLRCFFANGVECVRPWGSYSMAPIIRADRYVVPDSTDRPTLELVAIADDMTAH